MSYDGSGTYSLPSPQYPAVPGALIKAADYNTILSDLQTALSLCMVRDGQSLATGNFNMNGKKVVGAGAATTTGDLVTYEQIVALMTSSLAAIAALTPAADKFPYFTGTTTASMLTIVSAIRTVLASADVAAMRTNMGLLGAALLDVGTTTGTVCAGDDSRLSNSRKCDNTFDSASTSRAALGIGTAGVLDVGTTADKVVQLDSNGKLPAIPGDLLTGLTAAQISGLSTADLAARDQIALLNMRLLLNSGVASGALIQGYMWELLTDEWGATSTNEGYVPGTPAYYSNQSRSTTASAATGWTSYLSAVTFTSGGISISTTNSTVAYQYPSAVLVGDFDLIYTLSASSASYDNSIQFGVSTDALTTTSIGLQGAANTFNSWWFSHSGIGTGKTITLWHQQTSVATVSGVSIAAGDVFTIRRSGSALTLLRNGTQIATFTGFSSTANLYICGGDYYGSYTLTSVAYTLTGSLTTATLINPTFTISAAGYLDLYFLYLDETGGAVAGTDFTCELSGNGGTNYYTATLSTPLGAAGYDGTYTLYKARAAIAVTGTSPKARIVLNNTKVQRVAVPSIYAE